MTNEQANYMDRLMRIIEDARPRVWHRYMNLIMDHNVNGTMTPAIAADIIYRLESHCRSYGWGHQVNAAR